MLLLNTKTYLPNLVVIGAMKCGTTSLHEYLSLHPQISMSNLKELDFFVEKFNWEKGINWYKSNFKVPTEIRGESSPNYTKCHLFDGVPERMHRILPDAKLIYVVRDPVKRIVSHYIHRVARGLEKRSIDEALVDIKRNNYVNTSLYFMQLERYLDFYPISSILVISQEELYQNRLKALRKVFNFLNVDKNFKDPKFSEVIHRSQTKKKPTDLRLKLSSLPGGRVWAKALSLLNSDLVDRSISNPIISSLTYQEMVGCIQEDVQKLRTVTGYSFENWNI